MTRSIRNALVAAGLAVLSAVALVAMASPAHAAGTVLVKVVEPEHFADAGAYGPERDRTVQAIADHLQRFAARLSEGQTLRVDVLDVDLAGTPSFTARDVRIVRGGADGPRLHLRWQLETPGRSPRQGDDRLTDPGYGIDVASRLRHRDEPLPFEKQLLARWFDERIASMAR